MEVNYLKFFNSVKICVLMSFSLNFKNPYGFIYKGFLNPVEV